MKLRNLIAGALVVGVGCAAVPAAAERDDGPWVAVPNAALAADLQLAFSPFPPRWVPPWSPPRRCLHIYPVRPYSSLAPRGIGFVPPWWHLCRFPPPPPYPHPMGLLSA